MNINKHISRSPVILVIGIAVAAFLVCASATASERPNIVLIMADDLGFSDLGCYGSEIQTPNIDSLAARGIRFTQFYNAAVCCPSRAALLTGLYAHQAGMGWMVNHGADIRAPGPYQGYLNDRCMTIAEVLRSAGYRTLMSGKWHVGESRPHWPTDRGFDRYYGLISGASNYFDLTKSIRPGVRRQMAKDDQPYDPPRQGFYMTDAIADHAVQFLQDAAADSEPFFLYVSFTAPHNPLHALPEDIAKYRGAYRKGWDVLREERFLRMKAMGVAGSAMDLSPRDPDVPAWEEEAERDLMDLKMAIYAAQITRMDAGIGRILTRLRELGKEQNTLVLFLSDNGGSPSERSARPVEFSREPYLGGPDSYDSYGRAWANLSNTPLRRFKNTLHEGGIATPMIAAWPGVTTNAGAICRVPAHIIDFMPTFVDVSGAKYPKRWKGNEILPMEGTSLVPLLRGSATLARREPLFWELEGNRAMLDGEWKIVGREGEAWELYNLMRDRSELRNLAESEPERVQRMSSQYEVWAQRCGVLPWREISKGMQNIPPATPPEG